MQVASAIAEFEPVTVTTRTKDYEAARSMLPPSVRVVAVAQDDAWFRDSG